MMDFEIAFDATALRAALFAEAEILRATLEARIRTKLSGELLQVRSGALLNSISTEVVEEEGGIEITASSTGVPYAGILERGGKTAAHEIVAIKAKALSFVSGGALRFARRAYHPGSLIKAYAYLSGTLEDSAEEMEADLKEALLAALGAE